MLGMAITLFEELCISLKIVELIIRMGNKHQCSQWSISSLQQIFFSIEIDPQEHSLSSMTSQRTFYIIQEPNHCVVIIL